MGLTQKLGTIPLAIFTDASNNIGIGGSPSGSFKLEVTGASKMSGFLGVNGSPATSFPFEAYINSSTAYSSTSRGNVMRVYNSNTGANVFAGIELGGAGTANDGLAGINGIVTGSGSAALSFYTRDGGTFAERMRLAANGNVGIGSNNPGYPLIISRTLSSEQTLFTLDNATNTQNNFGMNFTVLGYLPVAAIRAIYPAENNISLGFFTYNGAGNVTERMRITSAGLVRINTTSTLGGGILGLNGNLEFGGTAGGNYRITNYQAGFLAFDTDNTERMRITSGGALCIGTTSAGSQTRLRVIDNTGGQGTQVAEFSNAAYLTTYFYTVNSDNWNAAGTAVAMGRNSSTGRSINAGGTINASGADYAEYMLKAIDETINKGDIVGVNENGELTNIFADAKSFVVKSTNPSYVGGDTWGSVDELGKMSENPTDEEKAEYEAKLEAAREKVDRIAFSGQVPCNVYNAQVGDYIIPINYNGKISGQAVTNPTFEQYQISVGKVWKIIEDGRAWIAVKIG